MHLLIALISGALFGFGLMYSHMVDPEKVLNFLDILGDWDPSLAFVMIGALFVFGVIYWFTLRKRQHSILGDSIDMCSTTKVTPNLIVGSAIFGLGWGMTGICPGPAVANIGSGDLKIYVFIVIMLIGMRVSQWFKTKILTSRA